LIKGTLEQHNINRVEYGNLYTRQFINENNQIVSHDTGREIFMLNVREDGSFISPITITHACRVIHHKLKLNHFEYHALRHTHATTLFTNGASKIDISERLGHFDWKTTDGYLHNDEKQREKTIQIVSNIYK